MTNRLFVFLALLSLIFVGCPAPDEEGDNHGFQGTVYFTHDNEIRKIDLASTVITVIGAGHSPFVMSSGEVLASLPGVGLIRYSSNGSSRITIVSSTQDLLDPQMSPDGREISYCLDGNTYIVTMSGDPIDSVLDVARPQWLSDSRILFQRDHALYAFDMSTRSLSLIAAIENGRDPVVSPDRSRIAFVDGKDLFTINVDGSNHKIVMSGNTELRYPAWSQSGEYIVVKDSCDLKLFKVSGGMVQSFRGHFFSFTDEQCPDATQLDWH
jgi:TolB protein